MTKDNKRIAKLEERRKKQKQHQKREKEPWKAERWFEFVELFDANKIVPLSLKEDMQQRMFMMGELDGTVIIQVPEEAHPSTVSNALAALARRGIRGVAFTDNVRFVKLRMCSPEEEEMLTEGDKDGDGIVQIGWPPKTAAEAAAGAKTVVLSRDGNVNEDDSRAEGGDPGSGGSGEVEAGGEGSEGKLSAPASQVEAEAREDEADGDDQPAADFELPSERFERERREREAAENDQDPER